MSEKGTVIRMGLDQSTTAVGWAVGQGEQLVGSGCYRPRSKDAWGRIAEIGAWLEQMVADWQPAVIAAEEPTGRHHNPRTDRLLGAVMGVVAERARVAGARFVRIHPMQVKKTGFHKRATDVVARIIGKRRVSQDEADAIGVLYAAVQAEREAGWRKVGS